MSLPSRRSVPALLPRLSRLILLLLPLLLAPPLAAQATAPVRAIGEGWLVVRAKVARGNVVMDRHLLVDLMCPVALVYHNAEALFLGIRRPRGSRVDLELDGIKLTGVPLLATRLRQLEGLTRRLAGELEQVPVVGILGWPAFAGRRLEIDPVAMKLGVRPPALEGDVPKPDPAGEGPVAVPLAPGSGAPRVTGELAGGVRGNLFLATGRPYAFLLNGAVARAGLAGKAVEKVQAGPAQLGGVVPFRTRPVERLPYKLPGPILGGLGWNLLRNYRLTLDGVNRVLLLERVRTEPYPAAEQAFILAEQGGVAGLEAFLAEHPRSPHAARAAERVFTLHRTEGTGEPAPLHRAGMRWVGLLPEPDRAPACEAVAEALFELFPLPKQTWEVIGKGLDYARTATDRMASYRLQHQAGRYWLAHKQWRRARRHLINAVFGLLHDGAVNLDYGRAWRGLGKPVRAFGAFIRALLDTEKGGPAALGELESLADTGVHRRRGLTDRILKSLEGRIDTFTLARPCPPAPHTPAHRPLVEFFTGTECRPCVGVGLALGAVAACYGDAVTLVSHHLHSPAPDPLYTLAGGQRARALRIAKTPTVLVDGRVVLAGGGGRSKAGAFFKDLAAAIDKARGSRAAATLGGTAVFDPEKRIIQGTVEAAAGDRLQIWLVARRTVYPGSNGLFVHHGVVRARLFKGRVEGKHAFTADLAGIWENIGWNLSALEERLMEQGFSFKWKPTRPDPTELAVVVFRTGPDGVRPTESLLIRPTGTGGRR